MIRYLLTVLLLIPFNLIAQSFVPDPDWRFENFNSQNHFINSEISAIAVDKYGYIWACSRGVQRFDGYKTTDFNSMDHVPGGLKDNYDDVINDTNGRIWVGSEGLCYYDEAAGKFVYVQPQTGNKIKVANACLAQKNLLWFVGDRGFAKIDIKTLKMTFTSLTNVVNPLCTMALDDNTLLISSREKVYIYNIRDNTYTGNTLVYKNALLKIYVAKKSNGVIYLGTNRGLFIMKSLTEFSPAAPETTNIEVGDLKFLPADTKEQCLFVATNGKGIMVYNTVSKKIILNYTHDDNNLYSIASNIVSKFLIDGKKRLWMATGVGISMLDMHDQQWKIRFIHKVNTDEVYINRIARDKYDTNKVWMSTYSQGIVCMNWKTKKVEKVFNNLPDMMQVLDLTQISKSRWLIATSKKVIEWDESAGILSQTKLPVPDSLTLKYGIRRFILTGTNNCFVTTNYGLFQYDLISHKAAAVSVNYHPAGGNEELQYDLVNGIYDNGQLWIASKKGLLNYDIAKHRTIVYGGNDGTDHYFFNIAPAINDQIACAAGTGLTIFNKKTKAFEVHTTLANLYKPGCESVISMGNIVWINTEAGILTYNLATHTSAKPEYETPPMQTYPGSPFELIGNDIVVGFRSGFAYFANTVGTALLPSDPVIESVQVNNQVVLPNYLGKNQHKQLVLGAHENSINISFTAFLYTDPSHIKFRYKLNSDDAKWQYTQDQRSANYAQLAPGNYTFYVQSGNKNGVWNSNLASFSFTIQPPYWASWWFRTLAVLVIAFCLYILYSYRIKNILAIERIRERIASDFHDDIGSALSSISIFSEVADKQLQQKLPPEKTREIVSHISFHSRAMLDAMDDIVWAVNPQNDHINDLAVRMREFAIPLLEARNIHFDIEIQQDLLNARIKMEERKNIFLIFKECINNILKHADCTAMSVSVNKLSNQLELIITDNGKGFDTAIPHNRNGLKNMQKRTDEIGGTIQVTTHPGKGTTIRLLFNII
jgi:ligand-binding sensor domain-containing protein/two-component sensor histidine kinase